MTTARTSNVPLFSTALQPPAQAPAVFATLRLQPTPLPRHMFPVNGGTLTFRQLPRKSAHWKLQDNIQLYCCQNTYEV
jgi:hypothetical protein